MIHNKTSSSEKVHLLLSSHVKILTYSICLDLFWLVNSAWSVHINFLIQTRWSFHWRKQYDWLRTCVLAEMDLILTNMQLFTSQDNLWTGVVWITCRLLWCFYQLFGFSFWRHPFTVLHWWASDVMLNISKFVLLKKQKYFHKFYVNEEFFSRFSFLCEPFL